MQKHWYFSILKLYQKYLSESIKCSEFFEWYLRFGDKLSQLVIFEVIRLYKFQGKSEKLIQYNLLQAKNLKIPRVISKMSSNQNENQTSNQATSSENKISIQCDQITLNLSDLLPLIPSNGGFHSFQRKSMALIETPAHNNDRSLYHEQVEEGIRSISKIIAWTNDDDVQDSNSNDYMEGDQYDYSSYDISCRGLGEIQDKMLEPCSNLDQQKFMESQLRYSNQKEEFRKTDQEKEEVLPNSQKKGCNCKKTQCLKLYCDCFRENKKCQGCSCIGCHNTQDYEQQRKNAITILVDKNPEAFKPKIESALHTKGCNCKKSYCLKKYCQCYQAGLKCGDNCKCQQCRNCEPLILKKLVNYRRRDIPNDYQLKSNQKGPSIIVPTVSAFQIKEKKLKL